MKRLPLLLSFVLFLGMCMSGTYWAMQFIKPPVRTVAMPKQQERNDVNPEAVMNLFGGHLSVAAASNFQLRGVVVSKNDKESVAILVADGKPAEAVRVDSEILPGVVVKEVHPQYVMLSENGAMKRVELPANAPHGDMPAIAPLPQMPPPGQPIIPQPQPQPGQEPEQQAQQPAQVVPMPQPVQPPQPPQFPDNGPGRTGRRVRNNLNNPPQQ